VEHDAGAARAVRIVTRAACLVAVLLAACSSQDSTEPTPFSSAVTSTTTARHPRGRVTFIIDDGRATDITVKLPIFKSRGVVAVAAVPSGWRQLTDEQLLDLQNVEGWEIANHSNWHHNETQISDSLLFDELYDSKVRFEQMGLKIRFHVYPFGMSNQRVEDAAHEFYQGGVLAWGGLNPLPIKNRFAITRTILDRTFTDSVGANTLPGQHGVRGPHNLDWWEGMVRRAEGGNWLIISIHELVPEDQVLLGNLIDYIKSRHVPIVTLSQGFGMR
jgi:peptidoglycan/xylan/chitin deacetylase (PgdA/CDA1 family)